VKKLRAGIIGMGKMGTNHYRILSKLDGVDLVGIVDTRQDIDENPRDFEFFTSVKELVKKGIDYCVIATPTIKHAEICLELISLGIHVLIEKPIASTSHHAREIEEMLRNTNVVVAVGHIERYNSAAQEAKRRIMFGELGKILQIATRRQGPFPARITDVGVTFDLATHDINLTTWLTEQNYLYISANAGFLSGSKNEDLISVTGILQNSIVVNHLVNWLSPLKERTLVITGEKGTYEIDTLNADLTFYENGLIQISNKELEHFRGVTVGNIYKYAFEKPEPLLVEHQSFRDAILGKSNNIVSVKDSIETLRVAESIIKSYQINEMIKL
jgi:predicted dehydrogenase